MKIELRANYHGACSDAEHCGQEPTNELWIDGSMVHDWSYSIPLDNDDVDDWQKIFAEMLGTPVEVTIDDNYNRR